MTQEYENLSAFVDGENLANNANDKEISKQVANDPLLSAKWRSYHLTRDLLRNDMSSDLRFDISDKVAQALEDELPIVAPKPGWRDTPFVAAVIPIVKQSGQLAMVACVTAMVIFGFQTYNQPEVTDPFTTAPPIFGPQGDLAPVSLPSSASSERERMNQLLEERRQINTQINALIQDHIRQQKLQNLATEENAAEDQNDKGNPPN